MKKLYFLISLFCSSFATAQSPCPGDVQTYTEAAQHMLAAPPPSGSSWRTWSPAPTPSLPSATPTEMPAPGTGPATATADGRSPCHTAAAAHRSSSQGQRKITPAPYRDGSAFAIEGFAPDAEAHSK